jgi:AbiTii
MGASPLSIPIFQPITEIEAYDKGDSVYFQPAKKYKLTDLQGQSGLITSFPQRIEFSIATLLGIVGAVRNRLLEWSIQLEKQRILGEEMSFKDEEKAMARNQTFNIQHMAGIIGDVTNSDVEIYDYSSIHKTLKDAGVPKTERDDLEQIMDDLKASSPQEKPLLLDKAKAWVARNQEFLGAAASIVMKALQGGT